MVDDTSALENEADDTRDRIAATIDGLQDRLSPTAIVQRTVDSITASGSEAVATVKKNFDTHPATFAAGGVAIGLAVLLHGRSTAKKAPAQNRDGEDHAARSVRPEALKQAALFVRRGEPLIGPVLTAVAGAVLAQVVPVSSAEKKWLGTFDGKVAVTASSLHHRL